MKTKKYIVLISILLIAIAIVFLLTFFKHQTAKPTPTTEIKNTATSKKSQQTTPAIKATEQTGPYTTLTLKTADAIKEISAAITIDPSTTSGETIIANMLRLNRINSNFLKIGSIVVIPKNPEDFDSLSPFPTELPTANEIPKLMIVSQRVQAFGIYEHGKLITWGPVSTGKQSTPTTSKLYFTNWKGKEVHSSFSDEWILKWNVNLDNSEGIGMHQYDMPGYPASHSCIRMFASDAEWIYNWADQWVLSDNQQTVLIHGTPVLVFGTYAYNKTAPWKKLPKDVTATTLSDTEITTALSPVLPTIIQNQQERTKTIQ